VRQMKTSSRHSHDMPSADDSQWKFPEIFITVAAILEQACVRGKYLKKINCKIGIQSFTKLSD
jgi:hypothetical protein